MSDRESSLAAAGACVVIAAVCTFLFWPLLRCGGACTIDIERWVSADPQFTELAKADVRLNTWILAWVQHALAHQPTRIFEANVFHPAPHALAGSEHMLSVAVLTAPLRLFTNDATVIYNVATVLSFFVAGMCTYAFAAWLTRNRSIALAMGVAAVLMPWRWSELDHMQLLWAAWLPAVWLLAARCLLDRGGPRLLVALALVWAALIFSSYYTAYFSCFTTAAFITGIVVVDRQALSRLAGVAGALAVPLLLLAVFSLPYLHARAEADLVHAREPMLSVPPSLLWAMLHPAQLLEQQPAPPYTSAYSLPALLSIVACCIALPSRWLRAAPTDVLHTRAAAAGILAACAVAVLMALGRSVHVFGVEIPLPAAWAARIVPGFDFVRVPLRWAIVLGASLPLLAAVGLAKLAAVLDSVMSRRATVALALLFVIVLTPIVPPRLPVVDASPTADADDDLYRALAELPPGPVLEVPWPRRAEANVATSSAYMVASTRGWWPLLNGYTAYKPRTYDFLVRAGATLPERAAVERLSALTGVRWIVVHLDRLSASDRDTWSGAQMHGPLAPAYQDDDGIIYEVVGSEHGGAQERRLDPAQNFPTTVGGLPRTPLRLAADDGSVSAPFPVVITRFRDGWANGNVPVRITNETNGAWPGIDADTNGLVHVRYTLADEHGAVVLQDEVPLDDDVPAGATLLTNVPLEGNLEPGVLRLRLELVQLVDREWAPVGIPPIEGEANVVPLSAPKTVPALRSPA